MLELVPAAYLRRIDDEFFVIKFALARILPARPERGIRRLCFGDVRRRPSVAGCERKNEEGEAKSGKTRRAHVRRPGAGGNLRRQFNGATHRRTPHFAARASIAPVITWRTEKACPPCHGSRPF